MGDVLHKSSDNEQTERRQENRRGDDRRQTAHDQLATSVEISSESEAIDPSEAQEADARAERQRVLKTAKIEIDLNFADIPCVVRNISETGAMLKITGDYLLPERFILHVPMDGFAVDCQIVRRNGGDYAVNFIGEKRELATKQVQHIRPSSDRVTKINGLGQAVEVSSNPSARQASDDTTRQKSNKTGFGKRGA